MGEGVSLILQILSNVREVVIASKPNCILEAKDKSTGRVHVFPLPLLVFS
jgi:hypothetical protein